MRLPRQDNVPDVFPSVVFAMSSPRSLCSRLRLLRHCRLARLLLWGRLPECSLLLLQLSRSQRRLPTMLLLVQLVVGLVEQTIASPCLVSGLLLARMLSSRVAAVGS